MAKELMKVAEKEINTKYSWKQRFKHALECYCTHHNDAFNYIAEKFGEKALYDYFKHAYSAKVMGSAVFPDLKKGVDAEEFLRSYLPHHLMIGGEVLVKKAEPDELIIEIIRCGSKSMLTEKHGPDSSKYYCRHCETLSPFYEQMGWISEVKRTEALTLKGENIGCTRTFRKIKHS